MRQRSFSFANVAEEAKKQRLLWSSQVQSPVSAEPNPEEPTRSDDLDNDHGTSEPKASSPEAEPIAGTETAKPRKAIPVSKPNAAQRPGPTLRPKAVPKPVRQTTEPAMEKPSTCHPGDAGRPAPSGKRVEPKAAPFGERYERITTYLEKPLFRRVHDLHQRGEIAKIASLLNAAVREYLDRHYPLP